MKNNFKKITGNLFLDDSPVTIQSFDENKKLINDDIINVHEME